MYQVKKRDGKLAPFDIQKIALAIRMAFDACDRQYNDNIIDLIALRVTSDFEDKIHDGLIEVEDIQDSVEKVLSQAGYADVSKAYILYRKQRENIRNINATTLDYRSIVNAYLHTSELNSVLTGTYSVGGLILSNSAAITANYWLSEVYDEEIASAHRNGDMHIHDLSMLTGESAGWSLLKLMQKGIGGVDGKITSGPAKHLITLCTQMINFMGIMQNEWATAQTLTHFDTLLAGFIKADDLSYKEVKQCVQTFIYGVNTPSRWGTQAPFSAVVCDWLVPESLKDEGIWIGGKQQEVTYGQCQKEMDMVNRSLIEVMMEGDFNHTPFQYPLPTYIISDEENWKTNENTPLLMSFAIKTGIPVFNHMKAQKYDFITDHSEDYTKLHLCKYSYDAHVENTGTIGIVSINMPRIAALSEDETEFYYRLDRMLDLAHRTLKTKRSVIMQLLDNGLYPYTKAYIHSRESLFNMIGVNNIQDTCINAKWLKHDLSEDSDMAFMQEVYAHIHEKLTAYQQEDRCHYGLQKTHESFVTERFRKHDVNYAVLHPQKEEMDIFDRLDLEAPFEHWFTGGSSIEVNIDEDIEEETLSLLMHQIMTHYDLSGFRISLNHKNN